VQGQKRLLKKDEKNELHAKMQMFYCIKNITSGFITMDDAMQSLRDAFDKKR